MRRPGARLVITIPRAFTVEEAARELGFKDRSSAYELIRAGELRAYPLGGGSLRVPADALVEYLQRVVDANDTIPAGLRPCAADQASLRLGARLSERRGRPRRKTDAA